jgi:SAM-dependent methyltransferase
MSANPDNWDDLWKDYAKQNNKNPGTIYRRKLLTRLISSQVFPIAGSRIIDFGCGPGDLLEYLSNAFSTCEFAGVDMSETGIAFARKRIPAAYFHQADMMEPKKPPSNLCNWATIGICSEVLEHVDDPVLLLVNLKSWLARGADLFVTVPGNPMYAFQRHIGHRRHYTKEDLRQTLFKAGFEVKKIYCAGMPFFNFYQLMALLRGDKLIQDAASSSGGKNISMPAAVACAIFRPLMLLNLSNSPGGWQLAAHAVNGKKD